MFNYLTPFTYWVLIIIWAAILWFCIKRLAQRKIESAFFVTVLVILTIDAGRTLFESIYFGAWFTSKAGMLPKWVFELLIRPELVFIPKAVNVLAAIWIAMLVRTKWLPQEEDERLKIERQLKELEDRTEEQRIIESALRESEERFRNIVEASPMGMHLYELGPDGRLTLEGANPAADTILGINHNALIGKEIVEAFPALEFTAVPDRYREVCTQGTPWQTEDLYYKDGVISGAFQVYAFQTLPGRMATQFIDITDRKRTEETLSMTQFTVDNAAVGVFWLTLDGTFIYTNNAAATLFGYDRDEMLSMTVADLTPEASLRETILHRIKAEGYMAFDIQGVRKDGTLFPLEVTSHYMQFGDQEFEFAFMVDRTERKKAETALANLNKDLEKLVEERTQDLENKAGELKEANIRLSEVDRLKSALLSSVSHELKTPLTSILGYSKLTSRDFERDFLRIATGNVSLTRRAERISSNLSVIGQEGARLLGLIDNMLALSRIKEELASGEQESLDMATIIRRAVAISQSSFAAQPDVTLEVDIAEDLPTVLATAENMMQVIVNLLDNAAKFAGQGEVQLKADVTDTNYVRISVSDDGPCIPPEDREKVFEPFHQVCEDAECTIKPPGTGMGLPICKHIVENFGGSIYLECPESGGSIFTIELPVEGTSETG